MPAKLLQSLLQPRSFSWGPGCGSKRQKNTTNVKKDLGRICKTESSGKERENPRDRNRRWMMMNDYDYDGSFVPPRLSGPGMEPKICSRCLARARKELTKRFGIGSIRRRSGNLSTFDAKERNFENQQEESKKKKRLQTHPHGPGPEGGDILTAPTLPPQMISCKEIQQSHPNTYLYIFHV